MSAAVAAFRALFRNFARRPGRQLILVSGSVCRFSPPCSRHQAGRSALSTTIPAPPPQGAQLRARKILAGRIPATVNVNLNLSLVGRADLVSLETSYTFATPVLGGQLVAGNSPASTAARPPSIAGTLTATAGQIVVARSGVLEGSLVSYGDLAPFAELLWSRGVNNYMAYVTGNVPAGDYRVRHRFPIWDSDTARSTLGAAIPISIKRQGTKSRASPALPTISGGNPATQYQSGIDFHFDWGASHYLTKQFFVGVAGYAYQQITDNSGQNPILGGFRSRVFGVGPQIGYSFPGRRSRAP